MQHKRVQQDLKNWSEGEGNEKVPMRAIFSLMFLQSDVSIHI